MTRIVYFIISNVFFILRKSFFKMFAISNLQEKSNVQKHHTFSFNAPPLFLSTMARHTL